MEIEKEWQEHYLYTYKTTAVDNGDVHIKPVRNWTYTKKGEVYSENWIQDFVVDPKQIKKIWYIQEILPSWGGLAGHTYLTFEWDNGVALSFSAEARLTKDQVYSPLTGFFDAYTLTYMWGTERDFLTRRLIYLGRNIFMYPLKISADDAVNLFTIFSKETQRLAEEPLAYNTVTINCTNTLARVLSNYFENRLPYDIAWQLPILFDHYLMKKGFIDFHGSLEETRKKYSLVPHREAIAGFATKGTHQDFSTSLRSLVKF